MACFTNDSIEIDFSKYSKEQKSKLLDEIIFKQMGIVRKLSPHLKQQYFFLLDYKK